MLLVTESGLSLLLPECDEVFCSEGIWTGLGHEEVAFDEGTEPTAPTLTLPT